MAKSVGGFSVAVKTITIDMEAYELLAAARRSNESFSTVIKNVLVPASHTAGALLQYLDTLEHPGPSDTYLRTVEQLIAARENDMIAAEPTEPYSRGEGAS